MKVMLSDRLRVAGRAVGVAREFEAGTLPRFERTRLGMGAWPRRPVIVGLALAVGALALLILRTALGTSAPGPPRGAVVVFDGVGYQVLGVSVKRTIPQRGDRSITASGVFEIVKLRVGAVDGRPHRISGDQIALDARGTYYGASSPEVLGLTDRQWGAVTSATPVPRGGAINVKAVFDVPARVTQRRVSVHIGPFDRVDQAPAQTLALPYRTPCCSSRRVAARGREHPVVGPLTPDPVLG
jgi:hypothetical protein